MKKISPKKIIEKDDPKVEHAYTKFPGKELVPTSLKGSEKEASVRDDLKKKRKLWKEEGRRKYTSLHTHPGGPAIPSPRDMEIFLKDDTAKSDVIASVGSNGEVKGYFYIRKTRKTPSYGTSSVKINPFMLSDFGKGIRNLFCQNKLIKKSDLYSTTKDPTSLNDFAKEYKLKYRFVPAEGYKFDPFTIDFIKKIRGLEKKAVISIIAFLFITSLFFLSSNITGYSIFNLNQVKSNWIGVSLFFIGLIYSLIYLRRRKPRKKK